MVYIRLEKKENDCFKKNGSQFVLVVVLQIR